MMWLSGVIIATGLVGLYLRSRAIKKKRLYEALQGLVDMLVDLHDDEGLY